MTLEINYGSLQPNAAIGGRDVIKQLFGIFANDGLLVVAGDVVPRDAVVVDVVEDRQARLAGLVDVELRVVGLALFLVAGGGPRVVVPAVGGLVGWRHLFAVRGPEPSVDALGLEILAVFAALEVAQSSGCPDVWDIVYYKRNNFCIIRRLLCMSVQENAVFVVDFLYTLLRVLVTLQIVVDS